MARRMQRRRLSVALAVAVVLVATLAGCAQPRTRMPASLGAGFVASVLLTCIDRLSPSADGDRQPVVVEPRRLGWVVRVGDLTVRGDDRGDDTWSIGPRTDYVAAGLAIPRFLGCVDRHPLDWALARADSPVLRAQLYPYLRGELMPCLERFGADSGDLPSAADYVAGREWFDPYRLVAFRGLAEVRSIQAACPPAPPAVLAALPSGSG
ncbi:MAG: hypothetical protein HY996_06315 [Micrococcales bacterium]|nr:hypothetical protein [Micrococcales bacterium]